MDEALAPNSVTEIAPSPDGAPERPDVRPPNAGPLTHPNSPWTETADAELRRLYALADPVLSMRQIADELADIGCAVTRNAVIGRVHRLNLPKRGRVAGENPYRKKYVRKPRMVRLPAPIVPPPLVPVAAPPPEPQGQTLSLQELRRGHCRYPYGKDPPFTFCGQPVVLGCSWCPEHVDVVFQRVPAFIERRIRR